MSANTNEHGQDGHHPFHQHHFHTLKQQTDAGRLGMWFFLGQELLFFSGLFMAYIAFRYMYPESFVHAHEELSATMGGINTIVLITSSVTMALAVRYAQTGEKKKLVLNLALTIGFAFVFLIVKYFEYSAKFAHGSLPGSAFSNPHLDPSAALFFSIYFCMTGLHGIHVIFGIVVIGWILVRAQRGDFGPQYYGPVENVGLYWHVVDLIWIFLFPLLYLMR